MANTEIADIVTHIEVSIEATSEPLRKSLRAQFRKLLNDQLKMVHILEKVKPSIADVLLNNVGLTTNLTQLETACNDGRADALPGVGAATVKTVLAEIQAPPPNPMTLEERIDAAFKSKPEMTLSELTAIVHPTNEEMPKIIKIINDSTKYDSKLKMVGQDIVAVFMKK